MAASLKAIRYFKPYAPMCNTLQMVFCGMLIGHSSQTCCNNCMLLLSKLLADMVHTTAQIHLYCSASATPTAVQVCTIATKPKISLNLTSTAW